MIKRYGIKFYNTVIFGLLTLLGFSVACERNNVVEYGAPYATFKLDGRVESAATDQALDNILVEIEADSTYTDPNGEYVHEWVNYEPSKGHFVMKFSQIEGIESGEYEPLDTVIYYQNSDFEGGDGNWNEGTFQKTLNVKLKPKN